MVVFTTIVREGSFNKAARALGRTQGGISYHVAGLEEQLELTLFDRSQRTPRLTEAGRALHDDCLRVLHETQRLRAHARELKGGLEGRITLAMDVLYPARQLARVLVGFRKRFSSVALDVRAGIFWGPPEQLRLGTEDLGVIGIGDDAPPGLVIGPTIRRIEMVAVAAKRSPLSRVPGPLTDDVLAEHVHLLLSELPPDEPSPPASWRTTDLNTRLEMIRAGLGWARVPLHSVEKDLASGRIVRLELANRPSSFVIPLRAAYVRERHQGPASDWLLHELARA